MSNQIDYLQLSKNLGLHKASYSLMSIGSKGSQKNQDVTRKLMQQLSMGKKGSMIVGRAGGAAGFLSQRHETNSVASLGSAIEHDELPRFKKNPRVVPKGSLQPVQSAKHLKEPANAA